MSNGSTISSRFAAQRWRAALHSPEGLARGPFSAEQSRDPRTPGTIGRIARISHEITGLVSTSSFGFALTVVQRGSGSEGPCIVSV